MKKITYFLIGILLFANYFLLSIYNTQTLAMEKSINAVANNNIEESLYSGEVCHLFTHCLIANPKIAFKKGNDMAVHYDADCILPVEFERALAELYKNDFVLCDISDTYEIKNDKAARKDFLFPKGKKPLILSFDDVVYDVKKSGKGMADRLVLKDGKIMSETFGGEICENNEFVGILENFISAHPDFSHNGAKGIICLTGFSGILGYRTQEGSENRQSEIAKAKAVVEALKESGWKFASHSFAHGHMKKMTAEKMAQDIKKWNDQVASIVGKTDLYVYPYGEWVISKSQNGVTQTSKKHLALANAGFKVFFGVGGNPFYSYLPYNGEDKYLFMDRCPIDGTTLRCGKDYILKYFNPKNVIDEEGRKVR